MLTTEYPHVVMLNLLCGLIAVRGRHLSLIEQIRDYYSACIVNDPWRSPDVIIDCNWRNADRFLFRSREGADGQALDGVFYTEFGQQAEPWRYAAPPIPPTAIPPFRGRFFALHSAVVSFPERQTCVLIIGDKGSGKTTTAVELVRNYGGHLLSDENAVLHVRTTVVEPLPRLIHLVEKRGDQVERRDLPVVELARDRVGTTSFATHVVFLHPSKQSGSTLLNSLDTFRNLTIHNLDFGCCLDDSILSLQILAYQLPAVEFAYNGYQQLKELPTRILQWMNEGEIS